MISTLRLYRLVTTIPGGKRAFSAVYRHRAPYFGSIGVQVEQMEPHHAQVLVPKRRRVLNHIGTVHAIAACNGLEAAMGLLAEATCPSDRRWLPTGMRVDYIAKSDGPLTCSAHTSPADWPGDGTVAVRVRAELPDGTVTVEGTINIRVSARH